MNSAHYVEQDLKIQQALYDKYHRIAEDLREYRAVHLMCKIKSGRKYFTVHSRGQRCGTYLGSETHPEVQRIQMYRYARKAEQMTERNIWAMELFLKRYRYVDDASIRTHLAAVYQPLPSAPQPMLPADVANWRQRLLDAKAEHPPRHAISGSLVAADGTPIRSKSEGLILDAYAIHQIPYVYEAPFAVHTGYLYPDVTLLHPHLHTTYLHEHLGLFFHPVKGASYRMDALRKFDLYAEQGYYPEVNLLLSFDDPNGHIDMSAIHAKISGVFGKPSFLG